MIAKVSAHHTHTYTHQATQPHKRCGSNLSLSLSHTCPSSFLPGCGLEIREGYDLIGEVVSVSGYRIRRVWCGMYGVVHGAELAREIEGAEG